MDVIARHIWIMMVGSRGRGFRMDAQTSIASAHHVASKVHVPPAKVATLSHIAIAGNVMCLLNLYLAKCN